ncbi:MAG: hypothetical protein IAE94_13840 [Chthoniobacterales bacterium]|mgnify:CR=1 FL=1|nr:hypothetical protein [Chthoniobacterales bacterium]
MALTAGLSLLGFVALFLLLRTGGLPTRNENFFLLPYGDPTRVVLALEARESGEGVRRHTIRMETREATRLWNSQKIGLRMLCNWNPAKIVSGKMIFSEKSSGKVTAVYKVQPGTVIREGRQLEFERSQDPAGTRDEQIVTVSLVTRGAASLAVEGQFSDAEPVPEFLFISTTSPGGKPGLASLCGSYDAGLKGADYRKAQLLAQTWGFGIGGEWIIFRFLGVAAGAWMLGLLAVFGAFPQLSSVGHGLLTAAGAALMAFSVGLVFVILIPPFQAPDEPDHFLAYAKDSPTLATSALDLSNAGHFERIKFRTDEKFSGADVDRPMREPWASHIGGTDPSRSPIARSIWSYLARILPVEQAGPALLGIRVGNVVFVSLCLGFSLVLVVWAVRPERLSLFFAAPLLLTPSLCFFSVGVSNYPFLVGGYVVQAMALGLLWAQGPVGGGSFRIQAAVATLLGGGIAIAVSAADNGLFALMFWATLLPLYWFSRGIQTTDFVFERALLGRFSVTFVGALFLGWLFTGLFAASFGILPLTLPGFLKTILSGSGLHYLGSKTLFGLGFVVFVLLASRALVYGGWKIAGWSWLPTLRRGVLGILILGLFLAVFLRSPQIPEDRSTNIGDFSARVVFSFFDWSGQGRNDFLVGQSFWGNFGWLDNPLPAALIVALKVLAVGGLACLAFYLRRPGQFFGGRGFLAINLLALVGFVATIAAGYYSVRNIVNGRYLIGPYLMVLVLAAEGYRRLVVSRGMGLPWEKPMIFLVAMSVQFSAWTAVLFRYF